MDWESIPKFAYNLCGIAGGATQLYNQRMPLYTPPTHFWLVRTTSGKLTHLAIGNEHPKNSTMCGASVRSKSEAKIADSLKQVTCKRCKKAPRIKTGDREWIGLL